MNRTYIVLEQVKYEVNWTQHTDRLQRQIFLKPLKIFNSRMTFKKTFGQLRL
jgi:hypothetical protein